MRTESEIKFRYVLDNKYVYLPLSDLRYAEAFTNTQKHFAKFAGQWSGIADKREKEIYEGDLVLCYAMLYNESVSRLREGKVHYDGRSFVILIKDEDNWYVPSSINLTNKNLEVIGVIDEYKLKEQL